MMMMASMVMGLLVAALVVVVVALVVAAPRAAPPADRQATPRRIVGLAAVGGVVVLAFVAAVAWGARGGGWGWPGPDMPMGGSMGRGAGAGAADPPVAGAGEVEVTATDLRFDPATLTATAGEPVNLTLVNEDRVFHDLTVPDLDVVLEAAPGEQAAGSITMDEAGRYEFVCSVPGHAEAGMRGTLVVEAAGAS